jgi:hypothetical protein
MSAIVTSDEDEDWFTNSRAWSIILERVRRRLSDTDFAEFANHADTIGLNFLLMDAAKRRQVALWLLEPVEDLCGEGGAEEGWDTPSDKAHLGALAVMLRRIAQT